VTDTPQNEPRAADVRVRIRWRPPTLHHRTYLAVVILAAAVITSVALARRAAGPGERVDGVTPPPVLVGFVQPGDVASITVATPVTIAAVLVEAGDNVAAGQPIARTDRDDAERELAKLNLDVERAQQEVIEGEHAVASLQDTVRLLVTEATDAAAQLEFAEREAQQVPVRQAKDSPERAQLAYDQARLRERRLEDLAARGLVSKQEVDDAAFTSRIAAEDLANAQQAADAAKRVRQAQQEQALARHRLSLSDQRQKLADRLTQLQQAKIRLQQAQMTYKGAELISADAFVRAPREGAIIERPVHPGDRLASGMLVARLASLDPVAIDVDVAPLVVNALRVGEAARVDLPAIAAVGREARIRSIAALPGDSGKYVVRLTMPNPEHARLVGQTAYVTFATVGRGPRR
jgi:multidrug efflux pump subunit AcrA (membrane-fusion protein)